MFYASKTNHIAPGNISISVCAFYTRLARDSFTAAHSGSTSITSKQAASLKRKGYPTYLIHFDPSSGSFR